MDSVEERRLRTRTLLLSGAARTAMGSEPVLARPRTVREAGSTAMSWSLAEEVV